MNTSDEAAKVQTNHEYEKQPTKTIKINANTKIAHKKIASWTEIIKPATRAVAVSWEIRLISVGRVVFYWFFRRWPDKRMISADVWAATPGRREGRQLTEPKIAPNERQTQ